MNSESVMKFLKNFCSQDLFRSLGLRNVNYYDNGWFASSDSYSLALVKYPDLDKSFCLNSELGIWSVLKPFEECYEESRPCDGLIEVNNIKSILSEVHKLPEMKDRYKDCPECDGEGTIECDCCGQDRDCEQCDGEGDIKCGEEETGYCRYPENQVVKILDVYFKLERIEHLVQSLDIIGVEQIGYYKFQNYNSKLLFIVPNQEIYIVMMGTMVDDSDIKIHKIEA